MNPEELQQKIAEYYVRLPQKAQEAFASQKWLETLKQISERNTLNNDQVKTLGTETTLVLLGLISRNEFEANLTKELELPKDKLENILEEINGFILNPIINELFTTYNKNINEVVEAEPEELPLVEKIKQENLTTEDLDPRFVKLPATVRKVIEDSNYGPKIYILGKEHGLTLAQITSLEGIVTDTILGTTPTDMFETRAMSIVGIEQSKLRNLISEINDKILKDLRSKIFNLENKKPVEDASIVEEPLKAGIVLNDAPVGIVLQKPKVVVSDIKVPIVNNLKDIIEIESPKVVTKVENAPVDMPPVTPVVPITPPQGSVNSIAFKKLAGAFKAAGTETKYSLNSVARQGTESTEGGAVKSTQAVDPYRMPIE